MCTADYIKWPDRDILRLTMPASFTKFFKKCAVMIVLGFLLNGHQICWPGLRFYSA